MGDVDDPLETGEPLPNAVVGGAAAEPGELPNPLAGSPNVNEGVEPLPPATEFAGCGGAPIAGIPVPAGGEPIGEPIGEPSGEPSGEPEGGPNVMAGGVGAPPGPCRDSPGVAAASGLCPPVSAAVLFNGRLRPTPDCGVAVSPVGEGCPANPEFAGPGRPPAPEL
ncbi:MAG: hypothetical protein ACK5D7_13695, partial [Planctomycetota bacterium]